MIDYLTPVRVGGLTARWAEWKDGTLQIIWIETEDTAICDQQVAAKGQE